jgi:HD-like signal output (HDOD) protein
MGISIRERITATGALPTLPAAAMYVLQLADDDHSELPQIAALIEKDPALSVKVLRAVNSSFYGLPQKVSTISQAVVMLGLHSVKALTLSFTLLAGVRKDNSRGFNHLMYWRRSMYAAAAARIIAGKVLVSKQEDCFVAALLMDIGTLLLDQMLGEQYDAVCEHAGFHADLIVHETHELGVTHPEVAGILAKHWGLPEVLAVPMANHHGPAAVEDTYLRKITEVVWLASRCADIFTHDHGTAESISAVRQTCKDRYGMDELQADAMLCSVGQKTSELAALFEVRLNSSVDYDQILNKASQRLLELNIAQHADEEQKEKRKAKRMRRDGKIQIVPCARGTLGIPVLVKLRDLSASGIGITHTQRLEVGSQFIIRLETGGTLKTLLYTVRRCDPSGTLNCIGAELVSVLRPDEVPKEGADSGAATNKPTTPTAPAEPIAAK